eukprot:scaffold88465_cov63-Phaeocystis_antarctica.AAC.3
MPLQERRPHPGTHGCMGSLWVAADGTPWKLSSTEGSVPVAAGLESGALTVHTLTLWSYSQQCPNSCPCPPWLVDA